MAPLSTVQFSAPTLTHPVGPLRLKRKPHGPLGARPPWPWVAPLSTRQFPAPAFAHPVRSLRLNRDTHCSLGSRSTLPLGVCARNITGSASSAINLGITTGSIIESDAAPSGSPPIFSHRPRRTALSARMPASNRHLARVDFHPVRGGPAAGRHQRARPREPEKRPPRAAGAAGILRRDR